MVLVSMIRKGRLATKRHKKGSKERERQEEGRQKA